MTGSTPVRSTDKALKTSAFFITRPKKRQSTNLLYADFKKIKNQHMGIYSPFFKPAKVYKGNSYWYIHYSYLDPATGKYVRFKEYFDINRIKDMKAKLVYAQEMVKFLNDKLATGFNPLQQTAIKANGGTFLQILDFLFAEITKNATKPMKNTYTSMINRLKRFVVAKEFQDSSFSSFGIAIAETFTNWMKDEEKLSKKTINSTLSHLSHVCKLAVKKGLLAMDPFPLVDRVKKDINVEDEDEDVFEPLTWDELQKIFSSIGRNNRNFLRFLAVILYAWARPVEVCRLKVNQIDLTTGFIKFKKGSTKNHLGGFVQIVPALLNYFQEIDLKKYPGHFYIFSKENYLPGIEQRDPKTALKSWTKAVVEKLDIDKRMYALKHTGNIMYLQNNKGNIDLKWQQMQNRHSSSVMTDRYNRKLGAYFIDVENVKFQQL